MAKRMTEGEMIHEVHLHLVDIKKSQVRTEGRLTLIEDQIKRRPAAATIKKWIRDAIKGHTRFCTDEEPKKKNTKIHPNLVKAAYLFGAAVAGGALTYFGS